MAKKSGMSARTGGGAAGRGRQAPGGGGGMRAGRATGTSATAMGETLHVASPGERGRGRKEEEGMPGGVGEVARGAGEMTVGAARRLATGTREAAEWTQDSASEVVRYVKDHPWPSLLIGAGATWLAIDSMRARGEDATMREAGSRPGRVEEEGRGVVRRTAATVADASRGAGREVERFVRERPLLAGAAAMGVGMAVGMALPGTLGENRMLGEARDAVVGRAKQAASGTARAAREVARSASRLTGSNE